MLFFLLDKFIFGGNFAAGVAANIIFALFNFGMNFIFIGIIGEYVGRICLERDLSEPAYRYPDRSEICSRPNASVAWRFFAAGGQIGPGMILPAV